MGLADLSGKLDSSDVDKVKLKRNPPEFESGYDGGIDMTSDLDSDASFDNFFSDFESSSNNNGFGTGTSTGIGGTLLNGAGNGFDNSMGMGVNPVLSQFGNDGMFNSEPQEIPKDRFDIALDASIDGAKATGVVLKETFMSFKNRTSDDVAYLGRNYILLGVILMAGGFGIRLLWAIAGLKLLNGLFVNLGFSGIVILSLGLIGMGVSALYLEKNPEALRTLDDIPDISGDGASFNEYEDNINDVLDDLFALEDEEEDEINFDEFESETDDENIDLGFSLDDYTSENETEEVKQEVVNEPKNYDEVLLGINSNQLINRGLLFNTWKNVLVKNTPNFADRVTIDPDSKEFSLYETVCIKALANASKKEIEEIDSHLDRMEDSMSCTDLYIKRIKANPKKEDIAKEIEFYLKEDENDTKVSAVASIVGDFYKITVIKKNTNIVTIGDTLQKNEVSDFFANSNNKLPMVLGVNLKGEVVYEDAKGYNAMMITGRPRSGKSWFVLATLLQMMMFNPPSECIFVIVDPKESTLFNTLALMPHVVGLHNDANILEVMNDIIENEGARRAKILKDNKCDNIWDLRKKGIELPILYLVMDEVITIKKNLGAASKEFDSLLQVLISKLPYVGIRVLFIAHRAQGIIDKTNRGMIDYAVSVMGKPEEVDETLGTKNFPIKLINAGEMGVKTSSMEEAIFSRSVAVTTSDIENTKFIKMIASGFYKMGVEIPENICLEVAYNRDEEKVHDELMGGTNVVQYDVLSDLD